MAKLYVNVQVLLYWHSALWLLPVGSSGQRECIDVVDGCGKLQSAAPTADAAAAATARAKPRGEAQRGSSEQVP